MSKDPSPKNTVPVPLTTVPSDTDQLSAIIARLQIIVEELEAKAKSIKVSK